MKTIPQILIKYENLKPSQIEVFVEGDIKIVKLWIPSSIAYYKEVVMCGKKCKSAFSISMDEMEYLDSVEPSDEDYFIEDEEFYNEVMGIDPSEIINYDMREKYLRICGEVYNE